MACRLEKALYGLKQAGHNWFLLLDKILVAAGFHAAESDECLYIKSVAHDTFLVVVVYVDDLIVVNARDEDLRDFLGHLSKAVTVGSEEPLSWFLGISIDRKEDSTTLVQESQVRDTIDRFGMASCASCSTPATTDRLTSEDCPEPGSREERDLQDIPYREAVGMLNYLVTCTRPDIAYSVGSLCRYVTRPGMRHWTAVKRCLRYLQGTADRGITYQRGDSPDAPLSLQAECDADFASNRRHLLLDERLCLHARRRARELDQQAPDGVRPLEY